MEADGADGAIRVGTDVEPPPRLLAWRFKALTDTEPPGRMALGKQALDDD